MIDQLIEIHFSGNLKTQIGKIDKKIIFPCLKIKERTFARVSGMDTACVILFNVLCVHMNGIILALTASAMQTISTYCQNKLYYVCVISNGTEICCQEIV